MIVRFLAAIALLWILGFVWFATFLPLPVEDAQTDAVIVPTGAAGRIDRGIATLRSGEATLMLVSGVDREVKPSEFAAEYPEAQRFMQCCITLGFDAVDTRGNALEASDWISANGITSVRLVTSDWHMERAAYELSFHMPEGVSLVKDAVPTDPRLKALFLEYNKLLVAVVVHTIEMTGIA